MRDVMLIAHFLGLAMVVGTSLANLIFDSVIKKMDKIESFKFKLNTFSLLKLNHIGLGLLILSGGYLMTPYWKVLSTMPMLIIKLTLVVILIIQVGILSIKIKKARIENTPDSLKSINPLEKISTILSLIIVVFAVLVFH
jgi:uncharacterized membrane protein